MLLSSITLLFCIISVEPHIRHCYKEGSFIKEKNGFIEISCDYYKLIIKSLCTMEIYSTEDNLLLNGFPKFVGHYGECETQSSSHQDMQIYLCANRIILSYVVHNEDTEIEFIYTLRKESPYLRIDIKVTYNETTYPLFEYLSFNIPANEGKIMTRDERLTTIDRENIYVTDTWTPKIALFGEGINSVSFIGYDNAQSMELIPDSQNTEVRLILDDVVNHPHFYFPIYGDYNTKVDLSRTTRAKGDSAEYFILLSLGREEKIVAKFRQPLGYEASLIFTEHTDGSDIATTNAISFGTSDTLSDLYGKVGIIGNGLTYTKSVWIETSNAYNGSDGLDNPLFKATCDKLYEEGVEIIPHTITNETDTREDVNNGLSYLKNYCSRNWIDHSGAYNLEDLAHFGWNRLSEYYILDIMDKYNYSYAWAYIDLNESKYNPPRDSICWSTADDANLLIPGQTEYHQPLLFYNNNIDDNPEDKKKIYLWTTVTCYNHGDLEKYYTPEKLEKLVDERGVHISHHYFSLQKTRKAAPHYLVPFDTTRNSLNNSTFEASGWEIDPIFNGYLSNISSLKSDGRLWVPTLSSFADYLISASHVEIIPQDDGLYRIYSSESIGGFSLITENDDIKDIYVDGNPVSESKIIDDDLLFWFDLQPDKAHTLYFATYDEYPNTYLLETPADYVPPGEEISFRWAGTDNKDIQLQFSYSLDGDTFSIYTDTSQISYQDFSAGLHCFSVRAKDSDGNIDQSPSKRCFMVSDLEDSELPLVKTLSPFPNPFDLSYAGRVSIYAPNAFVSVYDLAGRRVGVFKSGGNFQIWDGRDIDGKILPSGSYFCVVKKESIIGRYKITLIR